MGIGHGDAVVATRRALYGVVEQEVRTIVEQALGCRTLGFMPAVDPAWDLTSIVVTIAAET
jgi:hypothetical protein